MTFLAIMRDSFREACDSKMFYVMLGLALFMMLLLALIAYHPVTVQEQLESVASKLRAVSRLLAKDAKGLDLKFTLEEVTQTNEPAPPWEGDYTIIWSLKSPLAHGLTSEKLQEELKQAITSTLSWQPREVAIAVRPSAQDEARIAVTTRGSKIADARDWLHEPRVFGFGWSVLRAPKTTCVGVLFGVLVNTIGAWVTVLVGVLVTSSFLPSMLHKGTLDLLLVKPIARWQLLLYKYLGGLLFMLVLSTFTVCGVWLVLGVRSGIWLTMVLLVPLVLTFFFAILYSVSTLTAVLTRSTVVCMVVTLGVWFGLFVVNLTYNIVVPPSVRLGESVRDLDRLHNELIDAPQVLQDVVSAIRFVLPRTSDLGLLTEYLLNSDLRTESQRGQPGMQVMDALDKFAWGESLLVSAIFVALMLGLATWRFVSRDY